MSIMDLFDLTDDTAPYDGTPILVDEDGIWGVFLWETRPKVLSVGPDGLPNDPSWMGFYIMSEFRPAMPGKAPMPDRFIPSHSLERPFLWRPLPARTMATEECSL